MCNDCNKKKPKPHCNYQKHVHEIQGSVEITGCGPFAHNHRFATVSEEAIPFGNSHYHKVTFRTDFYRDHYHEFTGKTSYAIPVGDRHVHYIESVTSTVLNHDHDFRLNTFIENPIAEVLEEEK